MTTSGYAERIEELRETILEAEAEEDRYPDDVPSRFYALGLRHAAGILGMPEGHDPATRESKERS